MAVLDYIAPSTPNFLSRIGETIWGALVSFGEARARSSEVQFYCSMSDEELAKHGLRRDEIVRHVFRDQIIF